MGFLFISLKTNLSPMAKKWLGVDIDSVYDFWRVMRQKITPKSADVPTPFDFHELLEKELTQIRDVIPIVENAAKGDIFVIDDNFKIVSLKVGVDGQSIVADSSTKEGIKWSTPIGSGDVVGPASSIADHIVIFNGTSGKAIKDSGKAISDFVLTATLSSDVKNIILSGLDVNVSQPISDANSIIEAFGYLQAQLNQHTHTHDQISDFDKVLSGTNNSNPFTPTSDYHPATKIYVDTEIQKVLPIYTDEKAQDAIGSILENNLEIGFNYDDNIPEITAFILPDGITLSKLSPSIRLSLSKADSALQTANLATVATSGSYTDLINKPFIPVKLSDLSDVTNDVNSANDGDIFTYSVSNGGWIAQAKSSISTVDWGSILGTLSNQTDLQNALNAKQDTLVNQVNIKSINGISLLGTGNLVISSVASWGSITGTLSNQTDLQNALNTKVNKAGDTMTGNLVFVNSSISGLDNVEFNTSYLVTGSEKVGSLFWNSIDGTLDLKLSSDVILKQGQQIYFYGKASSNITKGDLVQFAGVQGDHILIKKVIPAEIQTNPNYFIGVAAKSILNGEFGYVLWFGYLDGVYTNTPNNGDSANWIAGDVLYFSNTTGGLTKTAPVAPETKIEIAAVTKEQTGSSATGRLIVRPTVYHKLNDLSDVDLSSLSNGQVLTWSTNKWIGSTPSISWGNITGTLSNQSDLQTALDGKQFTISGASISYVSTTLFDKVLIQSSSNSNGLRVTSPQDIANTLSNINYLLQAGESLAVGDLCYLKSDGKMWKVDATAESTSKGLLAVANETLATDSTGVFTLYGPIPATSLTAGAEYYISETAGNYTTTKPTTSGSIVRLVGYAINTTTLLFFPDKTYLENE